MSIIWSDFPNGQQGIYGSDVDKMLDGVWAQVDPVIGATELALVDDPDPSVGSLGRVLRFDTPAGGSSSSTWDVARFVLPDDSATEGVGFRLFIAGLPGTDKKGFRWEMRDVNNVAQVSFYVLTTGAIAAYRGTPDSGTLLGTTSSPVIPANAWSHIECKVLVNDTTGTIEVRVNGVAKLTLTGQDTKNTSETTISQHAFLVSQSDFASGGNTYLKDLIFWDTSGSVGNDFQGSVSVRDLYPDADIALNWTPSSGSTGWDLLDETSPDDAGYIQAGDPPPAAYVASLTDLPVDVTSVRALMPIYRSAKTDGGDCNLQLGLTPNNTDWDDGADTPITTAFTYRWDVSELSPDTGTPWTPTEVNSAYVRANRTL
jgi:hypothetical protein